MRLTRLIVDNFRNLRRVELAPAQSLNLVYGDNGSGKTSLLEAISTLSRGYSFRSRKFTHLINREVNSFTLFAELAGEGTQGHRIGIHRSRTGNSQFKVDGESARSAAELATLLPVQVIDSGSFGLLEGGPGARRRFLDWLVFHVKHDYGKIWQLYARSVKHRNSLLRHANIQQSDLAGWDIELVRYGLLLDSYRQETIKEFIPHLEKLVLEAELTSTQGLTVEYVPGWDLSADLGEQLKHNFIRDRKLGFTSVGPHKSDLRLRCDGLEATQYLSRGQQKTLVSALYIAQIKTLDDKKNSHCIVLVDDLPSELDYKNKLRLGRWLSASGSQLFVSGVTLSSIEEGWSPEFLKSAKVFHVKHGSISDSTHALRSEE